MMNAARNLGLSADSTQAEVHALRAKRALEGVSLTKLYLPPADQEPPPLLPGSPEFMESDQEVSWWNRTAEDLELRLERQTWIHLDEKRRRALAELLGEAARAVRQSLK